MAVSRDGVRWERPDRRPYFPMGLPDEWDRWLTMMGVGMIRRGNSLYQYYWSSGRMHDSGILRPEYDKTVASKGAIGAVRQRLDGFMSADFAYTGGTLTTPPLVFSGTHLRLNIDTGGMGTAFVELRDAQGKPIPGFTLGDCEEIGGNFLDTPVRWRGNADLSALRGRPIVLQISARGEALRLPVSRRCTRGGLNDVPAIDSHVKNLAREVFHSRRCHRRLPCRAHIAASP